MNEQIHKNTFPAPPHPSMLSVGGAQVFVAAWENRLQGLKLFLAIISHEMLRLPFRIPFFDDADCLGDACFVLCFQHERGSRNIPSVGSRDDNREEGQSIFRCLVRGIEQNKTPIPA
ncbi:hypothetical protein BaRGS_00005623 [Batillaria attramentaria]|uniref:Uncharacterized protein n=1 Tax=Batillaria attramentaria TaxID=370345 RepID=A0ABD0LU32_9CAEN